MNILSYEVSTQRGQGHCKFVHGEELATWLEQQPKRIDASRVDQLASAIDRGWLNRAKTG